MHECMDLHWWRWPRTSSKSTAAEKVSTTQQSTMRSRHCRCRSTVYVLCGPKTHFTSLLLPQLELERRWGNTWCCTAFSCAATAAAAAVDCIRCCLCLVECARELYIFTVYARSCRSTIKIHRSQGRPRWFASVDMLCLWQREWAVQPLPQRQHQQRPHRILLPCGKPPIHAPHIRTYAVKIQIPWATTILY